MLKISAKPHADMSRTSLSTQSPVKRLLDHEIEDDPYLIACSKLTDAVDHAMDSAKYLPQQLRQFYLELCWGAFTANMEKVEHNVRGMMPSPGVHAEDSQRRRSNSASATDGTF